MIDEVCLWTSHPSYSWHLNVLHLIVAAYLLYASITATQGDIRIANGIILTLVAIVGIVVHTRHIVHLSPMWKLHSAHLLVMVLVLLVAWTRGTTGKVFGYILFAVALLMALYHARILMLRRTAAVRAGEATPTDAAESDAPVSAHAPDASPPMSPAADAGRPPETDDVTPTAAEPTEASSDASVDDARTPAADKDTASPSNDGDASSMADRADATEDEHETEVPFTTNKSERVVQTLTAREVEPLKPPSTTPVVPHTAPTHARSAHAGRRSQSPRHRKRSPSKSRRPRAERSGSRKGKSK